MSRHFLLAKRNLFKAMIGRVLGAVVRCALVIAGCLRRTGLTCPMRQRVSLLPKARCTEPESIARASTTGAPECESDAKRGPPDMSASQRLRERLRRNPWLRLS